MHGPVLKSASRLGAAAVCVLLALPAAAAAGDVTVRVDGLRSAAGQVLVALCTARTFTTRSCAITGRARAGRPVVVRDVPAGDYAVQAIQDGDLDRGLFLPVEGVGFSRDAPMRRSPPRYADAAVRIGPDGGTLSLTMRYFR